MCDAVKAGGYGRRELIIRINGLDTPWGAADLAAAAAVGPDAILVPKPSTGADIVRATEAMASAGAPDKTRLWAMIETPLAILNLGEIGAVARSRARGSTCFVMGTNDLVKETRADLSEQPPPGAVLAVRRPSRPRAPTASTCSTASTTTSRTSTAIAASACTAARSASTARR